MELTDFMFSQQFGIAGKLSAGGASPALVYALETSIQLALTELNEKLREIYIEVYTQPDILERIRQKTTAELQRIFGPYLLECSASDFYEMDIGTAAIMRGYMERPCDLYFTLERKIECFLRMRPLPSITSRRRRSPRSCKPSPYWTSARSRTPSCSGSSLPCK